VGVEVNTDRLFRQYRQSGDRRLRNELAEAHLELVEYHVRHYRGRGVDTDDLRQIALVALVRAVERFDPERGVSFATFASRTVDGELKRFFRDRAWCVRPPRSIQELHLKVRHAQELLTHRLGKSPTPHEVAAHLDVTVDEVLEAMEASHAKMSASINPPGGAPDSAPGESLPVAEPGFDDIDNSIVVAELLAGLPPKEQQILRMRFFDGMTQPEIAAIVGVSQSYLSRIIRRCLRQLRAQLELEAA
jgi:RNA polymerase sigma-B factor